MMEHYVNSIGIRKFNKKDIDMGNAMAFLDDKDNRDKYRKGRHHAECKQKIDKYLQDNESTKCPDHMLIKHGGSGVVFKADQKFAFRNNIAGINSRRHRKKELKECEACKEMFIPTKLGRPLLLREKAAGRKIEETIYCPTCSRKGTKYRRRMKACGGLTEYMILKEESMVAKDIRKQTSLRILLPQQEIKRKLGEVSKMLDNTIDKIITEAYKENEFFDAERTHYKFDF